MSIEDNKLMRLYFQTLIAVSLLLLSQFPATAETAKPPDFEGIWFYSRDMEKIVPEIDTKWATVVFGPKALPATIESGDSPAEEEAKAVAGELSSFVLSGFEEFVDVLYDDEIHPHALFFEMREGTSWQAAFETIQRLRKIDGVRYSHPTLRIDGRTWAFFDGFDIQWKTGVSADEQRNLAEQAGAIPDESGRPWRIDLDRAPFFSGVNLLAEDIRTVFATPVLKEVKPTIRATLELAIHGGGIGDALPFSMRVDFMPERVRIDPSSFTRIDLKPSGLQEDLFESAFAPYDAVRAVEGSPVRISGQLRFYAPGDYEVPPVEIRYACIDRPGPAGQVDPNPGDARAHRPPGAAVVGDSATLLVPATPPAFQSSLANVLEKKARHRTRAIAFFSAALVFFAWLAFLIRSQRRRRRNNARPVEAVPTVELLALLDGPVPSPHWTYMAQACRLLRRALTIRWNLTSAPAGGTGTVFFRAVEADLPQDISESVEWILNETDSAVAGETELYPDMDAFREQFRRIAAAVSR